MAGVTHNLLSNKHIRLHARKLLDLPRRCFTNILVKNNTLYFYQPAGKTHLLQSLHVACAVSTWLVVMWAGGLILDWASSSRLLISDNKLKDGRNTVVYSV